MMKRMHNQRGYTLVEMMVTVSIFALAFIAIGAIFLGFSTAQSRANTAQRLLNEGSFLFETVVKEIRMHAIDYSCATDYETDTDMVCLRSPVDGSVAHIRVIDSGGTQVEICKASNATSCTSWNSLVPSFLTINSFEMYVYPTVSPDTATTDTQVFHPSVLIKMSMEAGRGRAKQQYDFQTTVSSRAYDF